MENKFLPTFKNRPILGYIHTVDGEPEFYGHNMHLDEDDEIVYEEISVGIIPETNNAKLEYDESENHYNVFVDGYIFNEYTKAKEIIEREQECSVSVELSVKAFSYDANEKCLVIEDGYVSGVTILGKNEFGEKVNPGMKGSNIKLADFSAENNSICTNEKLVETLDKLNETLSNFNINTTKGGNEVETEDILEVTDTEDKFSEDENVEVTEETTEEVTVDEEFSDGTEETPEVEENFEEELQEEVVEASEEETQEEVNNYSVDHTVVCGDKTKTFSISLNDKIYALQTLINDTYESDGDWYSVEVFEDTKTVQFYGWFKAYRQSYKVKSDVYSLVGDRVEIHSMWVTDDEETKFNDMKANYSSTNEKLAEFEEKLAKYEAESEKIAILSSNDYKKIADTAEFAELKKRETYFDMSIEDIKVKADNILLDYAKSGKLDFATEEKKEESKPSMFAFAKVEQTSSFLDGLLNK